MTVGQSVSHSSGGIYITGFTRGNLDSQNLTGGQDAAVTKYDSGGTKALLDQNARRREYSDERQ